MRDTLGSLSLALSCALAGCGTAGQDPAEATLLEGRAPTASVQSDALEALDASSRAVVQRTPFPVLLLPARWAPQVMGQEGQRWIAQAAHQDGLHVSLHGSDVSHPDLRDEEVANLATPTTLVRGVPAWVTLNEQIRSVAWNEGRVAWSLEVECDRPFDDARCTEDRFVRTLAETLEAIEPQAPSPSAAGGAR